MYDQQIREDVLYLVFYGAAAMLSLVACCYLLFRRSNAIAPSVTSSVRLRRWTAAFFASMTWSHIWYMPEFYLSSSEDVMLVNLVGATLDFATIVPFGIVMLFSMLQDHSRPVWSAFAMVAPIVVIMILCVTTCSTSLLPIVYVYYLLLGIGLLIYMVCEVRQYGRWLRDNYADLEHKEVWESFVVLAVILLFFGTYTLDSHGHVFKYITQLNVIILVGFLLWRVETLSELANIPIEVVDRKFLSVGMDEGVHSQTIPYKIGPLLQKHCIDTQLYLQHDLTAVQLARAIGTNRFYLSQYFSHQGITYNAYINNLRIEHFKNLYHKNVAAQKSFTAQQLSQECGFHSYRTFSNAFKQQMGQTVTAWMKTESEVS